jgi:hypothetical protein
MWLKFNANLFQIIDLKTTEYLSVKSGNTLTKLSGVIKIHESFNPSEFQSIKTVEIKNDDSDEFTEYSLFIKQSSYGGNSSYWTFSIECSEIENYVVNSISFDSITIHPYEYSEEVEHGSLIINMKAEIDEKEFIQIKKGLYHQSITKPTLYFSVQRDNFIEKKMRYGQPLWSKNGDKYKINIILVEATYDTSEKMPLMINDPDLANLKDLAAENNLILKNIVDLLLSKQIIDSNEKSQILDISQEQSFYIKLGLKEVIDIDEIDR